MSESVANALQLCHQGRLSKMDSLRCLSPSGLLRFVCRVCCELGVDSNEWQIMDPKMDSACSDPHEEAAELYDVRRELLPDEVLGIMDQLLCHEVLFLTR